MESQRQRPGSGCQVRLWGAVGCVLAGRTPPMLQGPAEKRECWGMRTRISWPWLAWGALQVDCSPGSTFSRSWQDSPLFKGLKTHFPPTLVADSGFRGGFIPFIRGCFPLTAQISKMQMHLEMPPHFPPSHRRWALPMLCINKRFIRCVSVHRLAH